MHCHTWLDFIILKKGIARISVDNSPNISSEIITKISNAQCKNQILYRKYYIYVTIVVKEVMNSRMGKLEDLEGRMGGIKTI